VPFQITTVSSLIQNSASDKGENKSQLVLPDRSQAAPSYLQKN
jgi:hypothetical protein